MLISITLYHSYKALTHQRGAQPLRHADEPPLARSNTSASVRNLPDRAADAIPPRAMSMRVLGEHPRAPEASKDQNAAPSGPADVDAS
jgi:hypothetical protein